MRFSKLVLIALLAAVMLMATACGSNDKDKEANADKGDQTAPETGQEVDFPELDRTELGADKVIATFEGGEVKGDEFAQYLAFQGFIAPHYPLNDASFREQAVRFLIAERIIMAENVTEVNKKTAQEKVEETWDGIKSRYDEKTRQKGYEKLGITEEEIKNTLLRFLSVQAHFAEQTTDEDIQKYYEQYKAELTTADVRHILISTHEKTADGGLKRVREDDEAKKIADDIYQQLKGGADFAALAQEKSEDPGSKDNGGLYEGYPASTWAPGFQEAVIEQEVGVVGEPVQTMYGFHVIKVEKRDIRPLDEKLKEGIVYQITDEKFTDYFDQVLPDKIKEIHISES